MGLSTAINGRGGAGGPGNRTAYVPAGASGQLVTVARLLGSASTISLRAGGNGNLTLAAGNKIRLAAGLADGASQDALIQEDIGAGNDARQVKYRLRVTARASGTPTPTPTPDFPAGMKLFWDADTIPAQTDNSAIASWTDSIAGVPMAQASSGNRPVYRAARTNGKPAVQFSDNQWLDIGRPAALMDALANSQNEIGCTLILAIAVTGEWAAFRTLWSAGEVNDGNRNILVNATVAGGRNSGFNGDWLGYRLVAIRHSTISTNQSGLGHLSIDMTSWNVAGLEPHPANSYTLGGVGAGQSTDWSFNGDVMAVCVYDRELTPAELARVHKVFCAKYGAPLPWAGQPFFTAFDGDSKTAGIGSAFSGPPNRTAPMNSWAYELMEEKSKPWGSWANYAVPSRTSSMMALSAPSTYTGLAAELGIPVILCADEYYNQPEPTGAGMLSFLSTVRAADPSIKIAVGTDSGSDKARADNTTGILPFAAAVSASPNKDVFVPLHLDPLMGYATVNNATSYPTTYLSDAIGHPTNAGYARKKDVWSPYYDTLAALVAP